MRNKSGFLKAFGTAFEVFKSVTDEVLAQGGSDEDVRRILTDRKVRQEMVSALLKKAKNAVNFAFQSLVNYDRSVELGIQAGNYDWRNDNITDQHFPPEKGEAGTKEVSFELVHLNKAVSNEQALQELANRNLRPATLRELLAFGENYPDEQRKYPIVALGSVWRDFHGYRGVPCLRSDGGRRCLSLHWYGDGWRSNCRFLAVRK